ncbi:UDP-glycosyltransferase 88B1-like protein [Tanacetum coccineum]|uniref:UDP-glycosyltransferase 88B1-like protein n=1 Tax=Tanacetum coccineum TaxID=301880 RepID=A0ABQ4ZCF3_9ASTR
MENVVVMYPSLGIGHLISMVELGELILSQDPTLSITILLTPQHYETKSTANYIKNVTSATPSITFHHLPKLPNPPDYSTPFFDLVFQLIKSYNPIVHDTLLSISKNSDIKGVVIDFLANDAFDVCLIVNTFAALEPRFMKSLSNGEHNPDGPTPQLYYVGPLIRGDSSDNSNDKCLNWLDSQPKKSVVVLIFGSIGKFKKDQLMEMAKGLEKSGQRFLWVVRNPPPENGKEHAFALKEPELDDLLPDGFLSRTKEKGLVVKNWAPQGEILRHKSVGGFVCHCGWNSVLEAIHAGVPMIAWPLYAEQKMNRLHLVEGIKVALRLKMSEDGFVTADELAESLKELMVEESGKKLRAHVEEMSASAKAAVVDGGSSRVALAELVGSLKSV